IDMKRARPHPLLVLPEVRGDSANCGGRFRSLRWTHNLPWFDWRRCLLRLPILWFLLLWFLLLWFLLLFLFFRWVLGKGYIMRKSYKYDDGHTQAAAAHHRSPRRWNFLKLQHTNSP